MSRNRTSACSSTPCTSSGPGTPPVDLAAVDPALIDYVQLSDNTIRQRGAAYAQDTIDRMPPGEGEFPLQDLLATLPPDVAIGLEVPMLSSAEAGEPTRERVRRCVRAARDLLARVHAARPGPTAVEGTAG